MEIIDRWRIMAINVSRTFSE